MKNKTHNDKNTHNLTYTKKKQEGVGPDEEMMDSGWVDMYWSGPRHMGAVSSNTGLDRAP